MTTLSEEQLSGIAVIGMAGRFPKADNVDAFWRNIRDGVECITFFTDDELAAAGVDAQLLQNPHYVKGGAVLGDVETFDAAFFGINPREAELMDPQQRLFLETAWVSLEHSGVNPADFAGRIGVFGGTGSGSYFLQNLLPNRQLMELVGGFQAGLLNDKDFLCTRVAYKLNLTGPTVTVQTACSSSLVAVHLACQSLLSGECDMALAGGVSVRVPQKTGYLYSEGGIASPDGHCRAFDADARGTVFGNGVGVVALKRLDRAVADGDHVYAVIKGSACNNDGSGKVGYTAPSVDGQAEVIAEALAMADFHPDTVTYIETHGTGTNLGDPIEVAALTRAFTAHTDRKGYCAIGSLKTNIGHLDTAAGVAGLIKAVLAVYHRQLPPSLHYRAPNPHIDFANSPFYVNAALQSWEPGDLPRRAGVSAFGIGGTNVHVVLEEAPVLTDDVPPKHWHVLPLSARSPEALQAATDNLARHLKENPGLDLGQVAVTLQTGRKAMVHRRVLVASDVAEAVHACAVADGSKGEAPDAPATVAFLFPGQGAQYVGMGRQLYGAEAVFRQALDRCADLLYPHLGLDIRTVLFAPDGDAEAAADRLRQTTLTQPALFAVEYALAQQWLAWGIKPTAMMGHSIGEYVAACLAGVLSLEDALGLVAARGRLMQSLPPGEMLAVSLSEADAVTFLNDELSLAAVNAPKSCVIAGTADALERLETQLAERGVVARRLHTSHAFHSHMTEPILGQFTRLVEQVTLRPPQIPFISNVTGDWITAAEATDPHYWARHLRQTVRFADGVDHLLAQANQVLLEVGPGQTLCGLTRRHPRYARGRWLMPSLPAANDLQEDGALCHLALGKLWVAGVAVDWTRLYRNGLPRRIPLPTYPFERRRYWVDLVAPEAKQESGHRSLDKKSDPADWFYVPSWRRSAPLLAPNAEALAKAGRATWVVLADQAGLSEALIQRISEAGGDVVRVVEGQGFGRLADGTFTLNPATTSDYEALWLALTQQGTVPQHVVHCWTVTDEPSGSALTGDVTGFASLLSLTQSLGNAYPNQALSLTVVSNHTQRVLGDETLVPSKVMVLGPCLTIPQEFPHVACRHVDVTRAPSPQPSWERLAGQLWAELLSPAPAAPVAYRGAHRWVQDSEPVRLAAPLASDLPLKEAGVYLITGGLGGVGLALASYLAQNYKARLILVGRSSFPARHEWSGWLASHGEADPVSRKITQIMTMEGWGAQVLVAQADVAATAAMQAVVDQARVTFGAIHGVIHTAGVAGGGIMQFKTMEQAQQVMAAKVQGTVVLDSLFAHQPLDFMVLCSSLRSVLGKFGQSDYSAANLFLDAYAACANEPTRRVVAMNWPTWSEAGMALDSLATMDSPEWQAEIREEIRHAGITHAEGADAFCRALVSGECQVIVSPQDLVALREASDAATAQALLERREEAQHGQAAHARPAVRTDYVAPRNETEETIAGVWRQLLGIDAVGIHDNFFELGGDSLVALQVMARLNKASIRLTSKQLFEYPTVAELANLAATGAALVADQGVVEGPVPLTPVQHWFVAQDRPERNHWNQAILLETPPEINVGAMEEAVRHLLRHHDALRLRLQRVGETWTQWNAGLADDVYSNLFTRIDLRAVPREEQSKAVETLSDQMQRQLDLAHGPLMRLAHFDLGAERPGRLLLVVHHWVVEAVSWQILLEDLATLYQQLNQGQQPSLPAKTTSFKQWAEVLTEYAKSPALAAEQDYWLEPNRAQVAPLPLNRPDAFNSEASAQVITVGLAEGETEALLREVPKAYHTQLNEVLLAALAQALSTWTGAPRHLVDIEGHGRDPILDNVDVSRTVGWFTAVYPLLLTVPQGGLGELLKAVKEYVRQVPNRGMGYGLLRYLRGDEALSRQLAALPQAPISFLLLGQTNQEGAVEGVFRRAPESAGAHHHPEGPRKYLLDVDAGVHDGRLVVNFTYSAQVHRAETIEALALNFVQVLTAMIRHCLSPEAGGYTPSDFPEAGLDQGALDDILAELAEAEEVETRVNAQRR
ncbi:MAG TPA: SDR family NAD(P)-dependent oxidoreductase [Symbiobacteriaceae bacterium]|nr:SDR family NAD(P)-dependent oxidoreductase [Symbiobacteriaceae bacterium]